MSRMSEHIREQQEREGWDEISDRPSDPPEPSAAQKHAEVIQQKYPGMAALWPKGKQ